MMETIPIGVYPSCRQTTRASLLSHDAGQIEVHEPPLHSSTLPSCTVLPPTNLIAPWLHCCSVTNHAA